MSDYERTPEFRKDLNQERRLQSLNEMLAPLESGLIANQEAPRLPVVFIVGAPRSGTTLLAQLLAQSGTFGYVNNFIARFWMAPYLGGLISQAVNIPSSQEVSYSSRFGVTNGWDGPHEFGYFWSRWFQYGQAHHKLLGPELARVDGASLKRELAAMESLWQKPLFFKYLGCSLQIPFLAELLERAIFVLNWRHPLYNMQDLLMSRQKIYGDKKCWWSLRPPECAEPISGSPHEQVAAQVYYILKDIREAFSSLPAGRCLELSYTDVCARPRYAVQQVVHAVEEMGAVVTPSLEQLPKHFDCTDVPQVSPEEFELLRLAAQQYFPEAV